MPTKRNHSLYKCTLIKNNAYTTKCLSAFVTIKLKPSHHPVKRQDNGCSCASFSIAIL